MFTLSEELLLELWRINQFRIPDDQWVFFGFRGCSPVDDHHHSFAREHELEVIPADHLHPRCTLGQWAPGKGIAVFPGSTVPHLQHVRSSLGQGGEGANQLLTGSYKDYRKGKHKNGRPTGHRAFRQDNKLPIRRTADDLDFDNDDRVEYERPYDNLHAAWSMSVDSDSFASAGCQVVVGFPECESRGQAPDTGPWRAFVENAYRIEQDSFRYVLLNGREARRLALAPRNAVPLLRFGSQGKLVSIVQESLKSAGYYEGRIDEDFGPRNLRALLEFQTARFGATADDGIVGPQTASALGIDWPANSSRIITPASPTSDPAPPSQFRKESGKAIAPDGTRFANVFRKGVYNFGQTSIRDYVLANRARFSGVSRSLLNVMEAVSRNEGMLEAVNTWDNSFMTFGVLQWTLGSGRARGELPALLARLKRDHAATFQEYFGRHGLDVVSLKNGGPDRPGVIPVAYCTLNGKKLNSTESKEALRRLEWAYRFWLAGHDDIVREVQVRQSIDRIHCFYSSDRHMINGEPVSSFVSSEFGVALLFDQHVNRPGHVPGTLAKAVKQSGIRTRRSRWSTADESKLLEHYIELRSVTSMTDSNKRAQTVAEAAAANIISRDRGSFRQ